MRVPVGAEKRQYVREMFGHIAPRYDFMNRLMTLGRDQAWRRQVVALADPPEGGRALDVGAGTGDLAVLLAQRMGRGTVVALDMTAAMLAIGRQKAAKLCLPVSFIEADALHMPFADETFDCVVSGFTVRNLTDILAGFVEMARVARPGGRVVCLEVGTPSSPLVAALHRLYFRRVVPLLGQVVAGHREAYTYLPASAAQFPSQERLKAIMEEAGLHRVTCRPLTLGVAAIHVGIK